MRTFVDMETIFKKLLPILLLPVCLLAQPAVWEGYQPPDDSAPLPIISKDGPHNVILMIGDGMSLSTVSAARLRAVGTTGFLHLDRLPIAGFIRTQPSDRLITDSAAASTAMACGIKTRNRMIGVDPDGTPYTSILLAFKEHGMRGGLVATSTITHATPAGFASSVGSRKDEPLIAEQLITNKVDVLLGGGRALFWPQSHTDSRRTDDHDLIAEAVSQKYQYVSTLEELSAAIGPQVLGLFAVEAMTTRRPEPSLAEMTTRAIEFLNKDRKGFFLMVEGSQIDWANHENDADNSVRQTLSFDMAIGEAIRFAEKDGETLVVVTADHETGGLVIDDGASDGSTLTVSWSSKNHNGGTVPLYAYGPGALHFSGFHENTEIPKTIATLFKIKPFPVILPR